jgi:hypothetical protein
MKQLEIQFCRQRLIPPDISREELKKRCSENYPFGERKRHPYKARLKAMRNEFGSKERLKQAQKMGQDDMFAQQWQMLLIDDFVKVLKELRPPSPPICK